MYAEEYAIPLEIGDEFEEVEGIDDNFYIITLPGCGTHVWNGERIVPKNKENKENK